MNGNYINNNLNPFSVPPPNFNPRFNTWINNWNINQSCTESNSSASSSGRSLTPHSQSLSKKGEITDQMYTVSNGEVSTISIPPPPLPPSMSSSKVANVYNTHNMYPNSRIPTAIGYQGAVAYLPIPAETYTSHHSYFPPQPPLPPIQHNPTPPPPPPPPPSHYQSSSQRSFYYKRKSTTDLDFLKKMNNKKKKKPLSQNIPQRKDWSVEDARRAIEMEKEFNKRNRSASLIIKFPDTELNRDIVAKFHPSIDTVHFQQPSTPRFCFVTLKDAVNPEGVIEKLNRTRFGEGFLSVEYKKDREEDMNIGPEDIDPLTLYVGNLAQDVMKEDMVKIYPRHKRVDIGYAKKMKYTRYAFVSFKNVDDSIEAFKKTHATQLYSKSLIVRFRRLHGTVGMPGEPKPQLPQRHNEHRSQEDYNHDETSNGDNHPEVSESPWEMVDISQWDIYRSIKQEGIYQGADDDIDEVDETSDHSIPDITRKIFSEIQHHPIDKLKVELPQNSVTELTECKVENPSEKSSKMLSPHPSLHIIESDKDKPLKVIIQKLSEEQIMQGSEESVSSNIEEMRLQTCDDETLEKPYDRWNQRPQLPKIEKNVSSDSGRSSPIHKPLVELKKETVIIDEEKIEVENPTISADVLFTDIQIKTEVVDEVTTVTSEVQPVIAISNGNSQTEDMIEIKKETQSNAELNIPLLPVKDEPVDQEEKVDEDDEDDIEDDINFGSLLCNLEDKTKKLRKLKDIVL